MYSELEEYLLGYLPADYWYDEGVDIARDIISGFKEDDWKELSERLSLQNNEWKKKLAYCLYDEDNNFELQTLLKLLDTNDEELFEICLDSLRSFINKDNAGYVINNPEMIGNIKKLYNKSSRPTQVMLSDFLKKLSQFTEDQF